MNNEQGILNKEVKTADVYLRYSLFNIRYYKDVPI